MRSPGTTGWRFLHDGAGFVDENKRNAARWDLARLTAALGDEPSSLTQLSAARKPGIRAMCPFRRQHTQRLCPRRDLPGEVPGPGPSGSLGRPASRRETIVGQRTLGGNAEPGRPVDPVPVRPMAGQEHWRRARRLEAWKENGERRYQCGFPILGL
jgi:hypothetical protein